MNDLDYVIDDLSEIIELVGKINLSTTYRPKQELLKVHKSYDMLLDLRKKLLRIKKEENNV